MDENGIAVAVVSVSAPGIWFNDAGLAKRLARSCNEFAAQMAVDHPQRFGFFEALPLPDVKASLSELGHAVETLKCDGVGLMTNYGDRYLGDAGFRPVFEEINRRGLIVYVHPYTCSCDLDVLPGVPSAMIEFPHSTTRTIVSLLASDAFNRWPNIRFIFSHAGGTIPFLVNRVDGVAGMMGKQGWGDQLRKLHYDTAGSANVAAFGPLLKLVTSKQVLFGSDFPFSGARRQGGSRESPHFGPLGRRASRHRWGERAQPLSAVCEVGPTRGHRCLTRHAAEGAEVPCAPRLMPRDNLHLTVWLLPDGVMFTFIGVDIRTGKTIRIQA